MNVNWKWIEKRLRWALAGTVVILFRMVLIVEPKLGSIADGNYGNGYAPDPTKGMDLSSIGPQQASTLLAYANRLFDDEVRRTDSTRLKARHLLGFNSLVLTIGAGTLLNGTRWPALVVPFVAASVYLSSVALSVYNTMQPGVVASEIVGPDGAVKSAPEIQATLARATLQSAESNEGVRNLLVDLYKASLRFFLASMAIAAVVSFVHILAVPAPATTAETVLLELRGSPELVELLRGPAGHDGGEGAMGPPGIDCTEVGPFSGEPSSCPAADTGLGTSAP